ESPMPKVDAAPIQLSEFEIDSIVAYLQAKDGHEVTVALPTLPEEEESLTQPVAVPAAPVAAATAEQALAQYGCSASILYCLRSRQ
ncbi:MAG: hypothetical protein GY881_14060, partial [Gammaproteobacteria bacterium]|nr:hypothetical protein [Gammaproteobacteria bacterium]